MLQYVYRYNIQFKKGEAYRDWLKANDAALHEHQAPGWTYLGTWFSVRLFGEFGCESRFELESYESLGTGFGDDESQRLVREQTEFVDYSVKPVAGLYKSWSDVNVAPRM